MQFIRKAMEIEINSEKIRLHYVKQSIMDINNNVVSNEILLRSKSKLNIEELISFINKDIKAQMMIVRDQLSYVRTLKDNGSDNNESYNINLFNDCITSDLIKILYIENNDLCNKITLEITEGIKLNKREIDILLKLQKIGVRLALDDFGKEQANISSLIRINFDCVKIDKELIKNVPTSIFNCTLYRDVVMLCKNRGVKITSEGIENKEQLEYVKYLQVNEIQGFYLSMPK